MLPKIICFLFGHKFYADFFTGETREISNVLSGGTMVRPVFYRKETNACERCGKHK